MRKSEKLRAKKVAILAALRAMTDKAEADGRLELNEAETAEYAAKEKELADTKAALEREERLEAEEAALDEHRTLASRPGGRGAHIVRPGGPEANRQFESIGEWVSAAILNPNDQRLQWLDSQRAASDMDVSTPERGAFMMPTVFRPQLRQATPQQAIIRSRCEVLEPTDQPDAEVEMPALNQSASKGMYGGLSVAMVAEGGAKPQTDVALRMIKWVPREAAGHVVITDKSLRNWAQQTAFIERQFRGAKDAFEDTKFFSGNGTTTALGLLTSPATIAVNRASANLVKYIDLVNMLAKARRGGGGSFIWIGNQTLLPQLMQMEDTAGNLIWQNNAVAGSPGTLCGLPYVEWERGAVLGSKGDLMLVDLSQYVIKDGAGPFIAASEHVHFTNNKTVIKFFWNFDGRPWLDGPFGLEADASKTISPFVVLDVP